MGPGPISSNLACLVSQAKPIYTEPIARKISSRIRNHQKEEEEEEEEILEKAGSPSSPWNRVEIKERQNKKRLRKLKFDEFAKFFHGKRSLLCSATILWFFSLNLLLSTRLHLISLD